MKFESKELDNVQPPIVTPIYNDDIPEDIPQRYHCTSLIGVRMSGKTCLLRHLVENYYAKAYKKDLIMVLSPTVEIDANWKSLKQYKNICFFDICTAEILLAIMQIQKERAKEGKSLLLIVDDFGSDRKLMKGIDKIASIGRHYRLQFFATFQYYRNSTSVFRNNTDQMMIWRISEKELKKIAEDLPFLEEEDFLAMAKYATKEQYKFLYVNVKRSPERYCSKGFTEYFSRMQI